MKRLRAFGSWLVTGVLSMVTVAAVIVLYQPSSILTAKTPSTHTARVVSRDSPKKGSNHKASPAVFETPTSTTTLETVAQVATTTTTWSSTTTTTAHHHRSDGNDGSGNDGGSDDGGGDGVGIDN